MAKKKKKTILTAEEYKAQNGMLVTADQYRSQQAAANARKQAEEKAAANARSQAMTNSWRKMSQDETYSGGRTAGNTFGTYALKQQYDRAKNKKTFFNDYMNQLAQKRTEANKKLTQDATYLMDGKGDQGIAYRSVMPGADSTDARKRLNKYAQEEKQFNLDVQHAQNEKLVKGDYSGIDFGGHMGKYTDNLKETFYLPNVSTRNINVSEQKKRGYGNSGTDWSTYSDNDALQKKKNELLAQKEYYENRHTDPYEALEEKGQFTPVYSAWGESEGTQEAAKRFHQSIKGRNKDDINPQTIMDSIYGSGTYSYETQGMTDIERQRLDDDIMNRFYQMERPETGVDIYGQMEQERKTNEDMTNYLTGEIGRIDRQMEHNNEYNELMNAETGGDRSFHPENDYVSEDPIDVQRFDLFYNMTSPSVDVISSFINRGAVYDDWMKVSGRLPDGMKNVAHMLPEEIGKFNEYYNAGQKDKAMAFIEGLQYALGQRNQYYENVQKKYETTQAPILSYLNTFTEKAVLQPAEMLGVIAGRIFGDKRVEDPDSGYWAITNDINKTRQFVTEDMDKITRFFVETGTSAVDSFANVLMGNSMGLSEKALEYTVLGFFGTQAFQTSMNQNLRESNGDWAHSFAEATLDTLIETATEIFSVEKLLSDPSKFLEYLFKNAFAEGSEEFVGATFGPLVHEMLLHNNEWRERAAQIWRDGGYADDNGNFVKVGSEEEAYRQAMKEWNHDIFRSTLSGALSTGGAAMVGGVQNVGNRMFGRYQEAGRQIRNAETAGTNGQQVLLDAALNMKEGTKSNKQAQKIQEKLKANEKISDFEIGKLAENIYKESNEQAAEAARTVIEDNAFEKLEKTKMDVVQSREMARIISEAVMKGGVNNLSRSDRSMLMGSVEGFNVYKDFISFQDETKNSQTVRDTMDAIIDATRESVERQQSVSELLNAREGQAVKQAEDAGEQLASEEDIRNASGAAVEGARGVIVDGQWAKLGNLVKTEDGSLKWQVTVDGKQKTVDTSQIRAADFATANIMRQAAANPGMYSNGFTNMMLAQNELGKVNNVGRYLLDAQRIRMAAYTGMQIPANTLGSETARALYDFSKAEHAQNRQAQVKEGNTGKQGRVTFMGAEYGSQEWNKAISSIKNTNQRAQIDYIAGIAQRAGIEVTFRDAKDVAKEMGVKDAEKYYGWENGQGISINVEGLDFMLGEDGKAVAKGNHNMVVTFGHEMTHWLQRNSLQGYNQLESFVLNEMRRNGVNVNQRINSVMNRLNLNMEDAISEIVADSCDQILANEEVAQHIQETNKGLFNEIKGFVKNLIGRMKNAIKGMDESQSRDARAMMNSANRLAKVWLGAYDEAISGEIKRGEGTNTTRLSEADFSYETLIKKPDMVVYTLNELSDKEYQEDLSKNTRDFAKDIIEEVKQENDGKPEINNIDTGKNIQITVESIKHSIGRELQKNYALICHNMTKILENAVAVNELNGRQPKSNYSTILIGAYNTKDAFTAVRFNVNNRTWKADSFEILYSIAKNEIKKEGPVNMTPGLQAVMPDSGSPSFKVSISDLLDIVKNADDIAAVVSKDVADELGIKRKYIKGLSEDLRYSQAVIDEDGEEMTLPSLNLARDLYFKGTDADIEAGEKKLAQREHEMKDIIESDDFTALMLKNKAGGRYEILHPSTRKGIRFQLTYYGNDGEPSMHESYGKTGGPVDERENVHSMEELYRHYADMSYDSDLKLQVLRDNARFSQAMIDEEYDQAVKSGNVQRQQAYVDQAADNAGYRIRTYHGTGRADRVGTVFRADRATSGPMAFFTDNKQIAENYSKDKKDTSIAYDEEYGDYKTQFRVKNRYGKEVPVGELWNTLTYSEKKQAVDTFGYTTDFREAGYLLPNGRMLNFTGEKGKHYGTRGEDHRGISTIYASSEYQGGAAMMAFMRDGNIRVMAETPGVDIIASKEPTTEQYAAIRNMARRFAGEEYFNVDFTDDRGFNVDSIEYDGRVNPERIVNDIKTFFRTGAAPQQSVVSQFHYSKADLENLDAGAWIGSLTPGQVQTEAERDLINNYKGRRVSIQLSIKKQLDYKAKIKQLTDNIDKLTPAQLDDLKTLQDKLAVEQEKHARLEDELFKITSADGYAGLMYRQNQILNNFILGKTQDQVRQTVDEMVKETQKAKEEIAKQAEELKKLAQTQAVQTMKSYLGKTSLKFAAKSLKSELNSSMKNGEIENRLAEMALKKANGESIAEDARLLAIDMTNQMRGYQLDVMERLRGVTITIGPDEQAEMKGNGMTLASVREQLKGTGVKVKYGDHSSLDTDTQDGGDLRVLLPEMPQEISENSADALFRFISWAQSMREGDLAAKQSMVDIDDAALNVMALASTVTTEMTNDPAAKKQIDKLLKQVQDLSGRTEEIAGKMSDVMDQMDNIELAGTKAVGWASVLQSDVHVAIDYYNKIARMAAQEERNTVRKNLIEQLKSENTRKLVEQQEKYQELMKQDRKARELAQDNLSLRNRISTVASRINKRLTAETDQKNVPEEAKPLARQMLKMLLEHDFVYRHVLMANKQQREDSLRAMRAFDQRDGGFDMDRDLDWLIVGQGEDADYDIHDRIVKDLIDIETGLMEYRTAEGQKNISLMDRREALRKIDKAVTEIWSVIQARETANINHKNMLVSELAMQARDNMDKSRFKGEWTGVIGHGIQGLRSGVVYGNMTPEYFFKNLRNKTISQLYDEYHRAENRNGLEVGRAQKKLAQIAEETGYKNWDPKKRYTFNLVKGGTVNLTLGEMMSLYATWEREKLNQIEVNGPEESYHLKVGGFYTQQEEQHKVLGREVFNQRAHRLTEEDMTKIMEAMTPEQIEYVDRVVKYMTNEIGALGNEASMRMYGIKKYNEKWYFPFEIWEGVKSKKSDQGAAGNQENRAAHQSFTKRRVNNASNALVIRDFTETAVKHIGQMINYNTFAPAIEFMNRVMNYQMAEEGEGEDSSTKRNLRAMFGEIYGKDAVKYLDDFNRDVNGGVTRPDTTIYDRLLSTFKKSAVAGSASVALQQPLSYIRAAMMISPKYLATSINVGPQLKQIVEEMRKYSGVAVIKKMGKFDMNLGRSAIDYMMPDAKESTGRTIYNKASDIVTILPELMDTWTWCNMWEAVKKEQAAQNPGMEKTSDEFLEKVAERFNDVMRKTQVYDSVLVKSKNMRNTNTIVKMFTSFMSEPTLTANVLYDAVINAKEKGGKAVLAKAATTFVMSAILQAIVKGLISAGRSPQDKKTWDENVAYRTGANLISELNPMNLLPGYNDLMVLFKEGELSDDALSVVGKILEAGKTGIRWIQGKSENPWYRDLEDTAGVISQLFTNIPAKNLLRDMRAITNYIKKPWVDRPNSADVLKYQLLDQIHTADNMTGVLNTWLGEKGWETKNASYYKRIYNADKAGKQEKVNAMINYLTLARGTKESSINEAIRGLAKKDASLTSQEKLEKQKEYGLTKTTDYILSEFKAGNITKQEAEAMYKKEKPDTTDKILAEKFDGIDYEKSGGETRYSSYSNYDPLYDAIEKNSQAEIKQAVKKLISLGYDQSSIKSNLTKIYKTDYIQADTKKRGQIQNKLIKAYRELGISETEAIGIMQKWVTDYNKKQGNK